MTIKLAKDRFVVIWKTVEGKEVCDLFTPIGYMEVGVTRVHPCENPEQAAFDFADKRTSCNLQVSYVGPANANNMTGYIPYTWTRETTKEEVRQLVKERVDKMEAMAKKRAASGGYGTAMRMYYSNAGFPEFLQMVDSMEDPIQYNLLREATEKLCMNSFSQQETRLSVQKRHREAAAIRIATQSIRTFVSDLAKYLEE